MSITKQQAMAAEKLRQETRRSMPDEVWETYNLWCEGCRTIAESDPDTAFRQLSELLLDEEVFATHIVLANDLYLRFRIESDRARDLYGDVTNYLRELWWIASGQLAAAFDKGVVNRKNLARLTMHPDVLEMAKKMLNEGTLAFERELGSVAASTKSEALNWMRDEAHAGRFARSVAGQFIATWKKEAEWNDAPMQSEIIVADNLVKAGRIASTRWLIPMTMIAVAPANLDVAGATRTSETMSTPLKLAPFEVSRKPWSNSTDDELDQRSDEEVLQACDLQLSPKEDERLSELLHQQQSAGLTSTEQTELDSLMQVYQEGLLRKAKGLSEAVRRGLRGPVQP